MTRSGEFIASGAAGGGRRDTFSGLRQQRHSEVAQEAERAARQSAQLRAERDALELQLSKTSIGQQARERKVKELEAMATLCRGEHERCKGEVQRLRGQLAERDKERDDKWRRVVERKEAGLRASKANTNVLASAI